jgi:hypothetical protein
MPLTHSLSVTALGDIRWQLVPAEVFNSYRVGDYFNDESGTPPRHRCHPKDEKDVTPICPHETIPIRVDAAARH